MPPVFVQTLTATTMTSFPVDASATFSGGTYGTWNFDFTSGPAGLYLQQITIDLSATDVRFNTAPVGFASSTWLNVGDYQGTNVTTGLYGILPGTGAVLDGGSLLTFDFNDFTAGDTFHFTAGLDNPEPTLTPLHNCTGLGPIARAACLASNAVITAENNARLAAALIVNAREFSGATVTYTFGGPGFYTSETTGAFSPDGGLRILGAASGVVAEVQAIPEPATCGTVAGGLVLAGVGLMRKRKAGRRIFVA
jgi:hypothetical protein